MQLLLVILLLLLQVPQSLSLQRQPQAKETTASIAIMMKSSIDTTSISQGQERCLRLYLVRHGESEANQRGVFAGQLDSPLTKCGIIDAKSLGERSEFLPPSSQSQAQSQAAEQEQQQQRQSSSFDRVYSSDLLRAHDTCELILDGLRKRRRNCGNVNENHDTTTATTTTTTTTNNSASTSCIRLEQRLRERSYGTLQGMPWSSDRSETDKIWRDAHEKDEQPPLWESDDDIWVRVKAFLSELTKEEESEIISASQQTESTIAVIETTNDNDAATTFCSTSFIPTKKVLITAHGGVLRQILMRLVGVDKLKEMGAEFDTKRKNRLITPNTSLSILDLIIRCEHEQNHANPTEENEEEDTCIDDDDQDKENVDNDGIRGVQANLILFANTDHLNGEVRIHDD